jgi:hypothetical protein
MKKLVSAVAVVALLSVACGGGHQKPAEEPAPSEATTAPSASEDMPASPASSSSSASTATTAAAAADGATEPAPAPHAAIKIVALKLTAPPRAAKKVGFKAVEVKDDGTVLSDGKAVMKIVGNEVQDDKGTTVFAVAADGNVTGAGGSAVGKFSPNDELNLASGAKLFVSDDGLIQLTDAKGKTIALGPKFDAAPAWAKREAALLGLSFAAPGAGSAKATPKKKQ